MENFDEILYGLKISLETTKVFEIIVLELMEWRLFCLSIDLLEIIKVCWYNYFVWIFFFLDWALHVLFFFLKEMQLMKNL